MIPSSLPHSSSSRLHLARSFVRYLQPKSCLPKYYPRVYWLASSSPRMLCSLDSRVTAPIQPILPISFFPSSLPPIIFPAHIMPQCACLFVLLRCFLLLYFLLILLPSILHLRLHTYTLTSIPPRSLCLGPACYIPPMPTARPYHTPDVPYGFYGFLLIGSWHLYTPPYAF